MLVLFFSSRRRHTRLQGDWSSDVCSSDLGELRASTRNWVARLRAIDSNLHKKFDAAYGFALQAEKIAEDEKVDDQKLSKVVLSDVQVAWAKELQEQDPARLRMLNETRRRIKRLVEEGDTSFYQDFMDSNHLLKDDAESKRVFSTLLHNNNDDHSAARGLMFVCGEYIFNPKCA